MQTTASEPGTPSLALGHLAPLAASWLAPDGSRLSLRPVRPQDATLLGQLLDDGLQPACRRLRFHGALGRLSPARLAWLTDVDFDRHVAFVVTRHGPGGEQALGEGRYVRLADGSAELALAVGTAWQRMGIGSRLLQALLATAQQRGVTSLHGDMQSHNVAMQALMQQHGFFCQAAPEDSLLVRGERRCAARSVIVQRPRPQGRAAGLRWWPQVRLALGLANAVWR